MNKLARSFAAAAAALACLGASAAEKELLIGVNDSLTGPGAVYGLPQSNSVQMAADEINAAGGIKAGADTYKLKVIANDDKANPTEATNSVRKLIDRDDPSRMSLLASEFEDDPTRKDPIQFLSKNFAGVTAAPNGEGLYFRGSRTENTVSYIDGVKVSGNVPRVPPSAISSVSVYTGGLPARYGDVTGGVIVIETKTYGEMYEAERRQALQALTDDERP